MSFNIVSQRVISTCLGKLIKTGVSFNDKTASSNLANVGLIPTAPAKLVDTYGDLDSGSTIRAG
jgi:hypothetical protein